eukprot:gnl/TRDRNA2_/TRDRNA2_59694_c0_seq1.p1 gnl/TRDRNA2_/TRDRNA2_59694_c0~~gnl/TRDRNA2_/TRDRNA2_59694_c0_seq1.p1  ORF type:complete len:331 (-),score=44.24 gnl/TRDRNA2_/TRDRNA2_59694_c0_seq1:123-1115(-)
MSKQPFNGVRLLTVPHSTYCEAARWALQFTKTLYREETWVLFGEVGHFKQVTAVRALEPRDAPRRVARAQSIPVGGFEGWDEKALAARRDSTMVPCAVEPQENSLLGDSFEICDYAATVSGGAFAPVTPSWRSQLDLYGAAVRNLCYAHFNPLLATDLSEADLLNLNATFCFCVGDYTWFVKQQQKQKGAIAAGLKRFVTLFQVEQHDAVFGPKAMTIIDAMFDMVATKLRTSGQPFLGGWDAPGADDIIFASHSSWLLFPKEFGAGTCTRWPTLDQLPRKYRVLVEKYRAMPAGQHVMKLYSQYRDFGPVSNLLLEPTDPSLYPLQSKL